MCMYKLTFISILLAIYSSLVSANTGIAPVHQTPLKRLLVSKAMEAYRISLIKIAAKLAIPPEITHNMLAGVRINHLAENIPDDAYEKIFRLENFVEETQGKSVKPLQLQELADELEVDVDVVEKLVRGMTLVKVMKKSSKDSSDLPRSIKLQNLSKILYDYEDLSPTIQEMQKKISEAIDLLANRKASPTKTDEMANNLKQISNNEQLKNAMKQFAQQTILFGQEIQKDIEEAFDYTPEVSSAYQDIYSNTMRAALHTEGIDSKHRAALQRVDDAIGFIEEYTLVSNTPDVRSVARILSINDTEAVTRFTHNIHFLVGLGARTDDNEMRTGDTTDAEDDFVSHAQQLLNEHGDIIFTKEELQEMQEAIHALATDHQAN